MDKTTSETLTGSARRRRLPPPVLANLRRVSVPGGDGFIDNEAILAGEGLAGEEGAATAEYAIATLAAVGFAGLLVVILRSDQVRSMLTDLIERALTVAG